jgi:thiamine biosynthesis lipoprotein
MDKIWIFDRQEHSLPDSSLVKLAKSNINYRNILLNPKQNIVFLKEKGMKIGFGAIGKGYAANNAKLLMEKILGVKGGVVNANGDVLAWGGSNEEVRKTIVLNTVKTRQLI